MTSSPIQAPVTKKPTGRRTLASIIGASAAAGVLALTPMFEGTKLKTYRDPIGVFTYCTGATENAIWGKTYTPEECRAQLDYDLARHAEGAMKCLKVELTDKQKIAVVDFTYNVGIGAFCNSTLARKLNAKDPSACAEFSKWTLAGGRVLPGLIVRRAKERSICEGNPT